MFERSLLERIAQPDPPGARSLRADPGKVADSVLRHLRDLLNLRRGSIPARPDCGMPDFNDLVTRFPVAIDILAAEVRRQIAASISRWRRISACMAAYSAAFAMRSAAALASTRPTM